MLKNTACFLLLGFSVAAKGALAAQPTAPGRPPSVVIAGGSLDPAFAGAEVYQGAPRAAPVASGKACKIAEAYVVRINAGQFNRMAELFEDDAIILEPTGLTMRGRAAITAFYQGRINGMRPTIVPVSYLGDDRDCMVELAALRPVAGRMVYTLVSVDHFTLGDTGRVARMIAFGRPVRKE